jgi:hypothetical protein
MVTLPLWIVADAKSSLDGARTRLPPAASAFDPYQRCLGVSHTLGMSCPHSVGVTTLVATMEWRAR